MVYYLDLMLEITSVIFLCQFYTWRKGAHSPFTYVHSSFPQEHFNANTFYCVLFNLKCQNSLPASAGRIFIYIKRVEWNGKTRYIHSHLPLQKKKQTETPKSKANSTFPNREKMFLKMPSVSQTHKHQRNTIPFSKKREEDPVN